eukprot:TRINITY_DN11159_c0_g2_i3.p3 TRINITY_DN11159_c0_g2~~TRINITY_DN11159_c0_g2_i3.p3  ORF type:complete len:106 (-),score=0.75 TRINITY_DN11159_c0_g2_i3:525-842(-)
MGFGYKCTQTSGNQHTSACRSDWHSAMSGIPTGLTMHHSSLNSCILIKIDMPHNHVNGVMETGLVAHDGQCIQGINQRQAGSLLRPTQCIGSSSSWGKACVMYSL